MNESLLGAGYLIGMSAYLVMFAFVVGRAWEAADDWKLYRRLGGIDRDSREPISVTDRDETWWRRAWYVRCAAAFLAYIPIYVCFSLIAFGLELWVFGLLVLVGLAWRSDGCTRSIESPRPSVPAGVVGARQ